MPKFDAQAEWERLNSLKTGELRDEHARLFGWRMNTGPRKTLCRRICWKLRELAEGGLSERARARALEIAAVSSVREIPPPGWPETEAKPTSDAGVESPKRDPRLPPVGTVLRREFKGEVIAVTVRENGFEWNGETYRSLSAVARAARSPPSACRRPWAAAPSTSSVSAATTPRPA